MSTHPATDRLSAAHKVLPALAAIAAACAVLVMVLALTSCTTQTPPTSAPTPVAPAWKDAPDTYKLAIAAAVTDHGCGHTVTTGLVAAQIQAESNFDASAVSAAGAQGPAQILRHTFAQYAPSVGAHDPFNPHDAAAVLVAVDCANAAQLSAHSIPATIENLSAAWTSGVSSVIGGKVMVEVQNEAKAIAGAATAP
ncbi:transglycosylase SLT domain-containing protein (plasmid) [Gordonia polyisoprenivorans]|uniref:transglycosylase SLT domain-containing protein n=1 Tax=Gordonia polyisoprenivorans TaxID=84595 RepID=UPI0022346FEB|nr:transglycosylase SLT domain-containing protein [Gordonia polyisoprenivorans]